LDKLLSIDLGGTHLKSAVIYKNGEVTDKQTINTPATLQGLLNFVSDNTSDYFSGISLSVPGAVANTGIIYGNSAVPYIHGPNLKKLVYQKTNLPVEIENDANCAAMAEVWRGNAKGKKDIVTIVLGTGVGGAILKNGIVHHGANLHAGEFGCMILNLDFANKKKEIFSKVASTSSLIRQVAKAKNINPEKLSGEKVFNLAENGDEICIKCIQEFYYMISLGVYNLQYMFDPELILIGGGISNREGLIANIKNELEKLIMDIDEATITPKLDRCLFVSDANLIGAAYNFWKTNNL